VGSFETPEEAAHAHAKAYIELHGTLPAATNNEGQELRQAIATHQGPVDIERFRSNNKTGWRGVYPDGSRFVAQIWKDGKFVYLGSFETPEEAARAYAIAHVHLHGGVSTTASNQEQAQPINTTDCTVNHSNMMTSGTNFDAIGDEALCLLQAQGFDMCSNANANQPPA